VTEYRAFVFDNYALAIFGENVPISRAAAVAENEDAALKGRRYIGDVTPPAPSSPGFL
jgi:hypothetical protein